MKYCMNLKVFELTQNENLLFMGGQLRLICFEILAKKRDTKNFKIGLEKINAQLDKQKAKQLQNKLTNIYNSK